LIKPFFDGVFREYFPQLKCVCCQDEESEAGSCGSTHPQHGDSWLPQDR